MKKPLIVGPQRCSSCHETTLYIDHLLKRVYCDNCGLSVHPSFDYTEDDWRKNLNQQGSMAIPRKRHAR